MLNHGGFRFVVLDRSELEEWEAGGEAPRVHDPEAGEVPSRRREVALVLSVADSGPVGLGPFYVEGRTGAVQIGDLRTDGIATAEEVLLELVRVVRRATAGGRDGG